MLRDQRVGDFERRRFRCPLRFTTMLDSNVGRLHVSSRGCGPLGASPGGSTAIRRGAECVKVGGVEGHGVSITPKRVITRDASAKFTRCAPEVRAGDSDRRPGSERTDVLLYGGGGAPGAR